MTNPYRPRGQHFSETQRRDHLARMIALGAPEKAARVVRLPLFEVALRGLDAIKTECK